MPVVRPPLPIAKAARCWSGRVCVISRQPGRYEALPHHRPIADIETSTTSGLDTQTEVVPIREFKIFWTQPLAYRLRASVPTRLGPTAFRYSHSCLVYS